MEIILKNISNFIKVFNINKAYYKINIKGKYGDITQYIKKDFYLKIKKNTISLVNKKNKINFNDYLKTIVTSLHTQYIDISYSYYIVLEIRGVGYYVEESVKKGVIHFYLGYSHYVEYILRPNIAFKVIDHGKGSIFIIVGSSRREVFLTLFDLMKLKKKDFYKGKGIFYYSDTVKLKKGKSQKK